MKLAVLVGIVVVAVLLILWLRKGRVSVSTSADVQQGMAELAPEAVRHAQSSYGLTLDYTPESIEQAEVALGRLHDEVGTHRVSPSDAQRLAIRYGAYVGEAIRRARGGTWAKDHSVAGPNSFPLTLEGHDIFPVNWCIKRVANGPEDNVWHKYQISVVARPRRDAVP